MGLLVYDSNNSGGSWWLKDSDWEALEANGWTVHWFHDIHTLHDGRQHENADDEHRFFHHSHHYDADFTLVKAEFEGEKWIGDALATSAAKEFDSQRDGVDEWERLTGQNASALGCFTCCGPPHSFVWTDGEVTKYISPKAFGYIDELE